MSRETNKLLFDVHNAILKIEQYLAGSKKFEDYQNNLMLQQAVERNIEIIGEAVNNLLKINPDLPLSNARKIVNTRNKLIHGYDDIENSEIWAIIITHMPILKQEVEKLLK
ncbi:MAG TPA: HepT-like ribonuclease domain-containing protein [Bacteroidia bacterium]|nr:HepT-like ribonuclease domain-containing protein [Bacteroidia bacterium]